MIEMVMRIFLDACGLSTPLTLECDDPGLPAAASIRHEHGLPFVIVGRDPGADLHLNAPLVSRRHAYLQVIAGRLFFIDLDSRSHIRREGSDDSVTRGWLEQEHSIWLGTCRIRWRGRLESTVQVAEPLDPLAPHLTDRAEAEHLPEAALELPIRIGASLSSWTISSRLSLIGRSDQCQLVLTDNSISAYHASLVRTPLGVWVVDLLSREGVWVNGTRVRWAWLDEGDTLRVGRFTFVVRYGQLPDQITRLDVPLDAGAIFMAAPAATATDLGGLPTKLTKPLAIQSSQAARSQAEIATYFPMVAPLSIASSGRDDLNQITAFGAGPPATWNQHIQFLETVHSEMILIVRMFMTMHREQVGSIRDELDRVQQLTRELETLQAKLGEPSSAQPVDPYTRVDRGRRETDSRSSVNARNNRRSPDSKSTSRTQSRQHRHSPPGATATSETEGDVASQKVDSEHPAEATSSPVDNVTLHTQITTRIAELQRERHGYWRRILSAISGSED